MRGSNLGRAKDCFCVLELQDLPPIQQLPGALHLGFKKVCLTFRNLASYI